MKVVIAGAVVMLAIGSGSAAIAQAPSPEQRIETAMVRARAAGVPVSLLENKIAEGKAKGVSMERIAEAVERRQAGLERASQALQGRPNVAAADLSVAADAMESGVSAVVLQAVADAAPRERRVVAIAALTQLVQLGHVPQEALDRVREALKRGPDALANLPAQGSLRNLQREHRRRKASTLANEPAP